MSGVNGLEKHQQLLQFIVIKIEFIVNGERLMNESKSQTLAKAQVPLEAHG